MIGVDTVGSEGLFSVLVAVLTKAALRNLPLFLLASSI